MSEAFFRRLRGDLHGALAPGLPPSPVRCWLRTTLLVPSLPLAPGYLAGLKQGWAFSWRSLMAAEIIASSPDLGLGLGQLLENGRNNFDMPGIFLAILLILFVGIAIDLLIFSPLERRVLRSRGLLVKS